MSNMRAFKSTTRWTRHLGAECAGFGRLGIGGGTRRAPPSRIRGLGFDSRLLGVGSTADRQLDGWVDAASDVGVRPMLDTMVVGGLSGHGAAWSQQRGLQCDELGSGAAPCSYWPVSVCSRCRRALRALLVMRILTSFVGRCQRGRLLPALGSIATRLALGALHGRRCAGSLRVGGSGIRWDRGAHSGLLLTRGDLGGLSLGASSLLGGLRMGSAGPRGSRWDFGCRSASLATGGVGVMAAGSIVHYRAQRDLGAMCAGRMGSCGAGLVSAMWASGSCRHLGTLGLSVWMQCGLRLGCWLHWGSGGLRGYRGGLSSGLDIGWVVLAHSAVRRIGLSWSSACRRYARGYRGAHVGAQFVDIRHQRVCLVRSWRTRGIGAMLALGITCDSWRYGWAQGGMAAWPSWGSCASSASRRSVSRGPHGTLGISGPSALLVPRHQGVVLRAHGRIGAVARWAHWGPESA
jgi:hypothetical protein